MGFAVGNALALAGQLHVREGFVERAAELVAGERECLDVDLAASEQAIESIGGDTERCCAVALNLGEPTTLNERAPLALFDEDLDTGEGRRGAGEGAADLDGSGLRLNRAGRVDRQVDLDGWWRLFGRDHER